MALSNQGSSQITASRESFSVLLKLALIFNGGLIFYKNIKITSSYVILYMRETFKPVFTLDHVHTLNHVETHDFDSYFCLYSGSDCR